MLMRIIALTPVWFAPLIAFASPSFFGPDPELFGIPQDLVLMVGAMFWALIGVAVIWDVRSWAVDILTVEVFTLPAIVFVILAPALILILQNAG